MLENIDNCLVCGASGFIGSRLFIALSQRGSRIYGLYRNAPSSGYSRTGTLADKNSLVKACGGIQHLFHCAGYAHAFSSLSCNEAEQHWRVNYEGTRTLVESAGNAGVQRFVFLSSVKSMAEPGKECVDEDFPGHPTTAYGQSKRAAEEAVLEAGKRYGMHVVNLRLAMVYGSGGRGNLERMGRLVYRGCFPPLPETKNHRSLIHVDDVVTALLVAAKDDRANGNTYIVSSQEAPSGRQLYDTMREVLGLRPIGWSVPEAILRGGAICGDMIERLFKLRIAYDSETIERLLGSAWYSSARLTDELGWEAKVSLREGLLEMLGC